MDEILKGLKSASPEGGKSRTVPSAYGAESNLYSLEKPINQNGDLELESQFSARRLASQNGSFFGSRTAGGSLGEILSPHTFIGEQYRVLRAKLSLMQKESGLKTLLVSSSVPNEGKTLVSCGLALILAQEVGKRVLLIDADLRKPDVNRTLGLGSEDRFDGLSGVLRGQLDLEEAIVASASEDLCLLPAGPVPADPAELLTSRYLELVLRAASKSFDWVIIDSPPLLPMADTSILARLCDKVLLVVRANSTSANLIKASIQTIGDDKFCGVLLNRVRDLKMSTYHYYYYHHHNQRRQK